MHAFRLLSANLWGERSDPRALGALLTAHAPDVVLAQELAPAQADVIARALPYGLLLPRSDADGIGLALRWPASCERIALPGRDAIAAQLSADSAAPFATPLEIVNLHLSAPTRVARFALRRAQVAALSRHLRADSCARVLAGDFNSTPWMPAYRVLLRDMHDAAVDRERAPRPTWSPSAHLPRLLRIDHLLLRGLDALELTVLRVRGSDHSALLATLAPHAEVATR